MKMTAVMGEDSGTSTVLAPESSATGTTKPSVPVYACEVCGRVFGRRSNLSRHHRLHSGEKPFTCPECQRSFTHRSSLTHHLRLHTGERPYQCSLCPRTFRQRPNYTLHLKTHTGDKDFRCHTCGKEFAQRVHLTAHTRLHSGDRPYACQDCGRRFPQRCHLTCHRDTRRGQAKHLCDLCDGRFFSRSCLAAHKETHKGGARAKGVKRQPSDVQEKDLGSGRKRTKEGKVTWGDRAEDDKEKEDVDSSQGQDRAENMKGKAVGDSTEGKRVTWGDREEDGCGKGVDDSSQGQKIVKDLNGKTVRDRVNDEDGAEGKEKDVGWEENRDHSFKGLDGEESRVKGKGVVWFKNRDKALGDNHKKQGKDEEMKGTDIGDKINMQGEDNSGKDMSDRHRKPGVDEAEGGRGRGGMVQAVECEVCHKTFRKPSRLRHHHRTHTGEQPHQCPKCDRRFSHVRSLRRHLLALHVKAKLPHTHTHTHGKIRSSVTVTPNTQDSIPTHTPTLTPTKRDSGRISHSHLTLDKTAPSPTHAGDTPTHTPTHHTQVKIGECFDEVMSPLTKKRGAETSLEEFLSPSNTCSPVGVGGGRTVECSGEVMSPHLTKNRGAETSLEELLSIPNTCSPLGVGGNKSSECIGEVMSPPSTKNSSSETSLEELLSVPNTCSSVGVKGTKSDEYTDSSSGNHKTGAPGVYQQNGTPTSQSVTLPLHLKTQPQGTETQRLGSCTPILPYPSTSTSQVTTHGLTLMEDPEHKVKTEVIDDANKVLAAGTSEVDGLGKQENKADHTRLSSFPLTAQPLVAVSLFLFGKRVKEETVGDGELSVKEEFEMVEEAV